MSDRKFVGQIKFPEQALRDLGARDDYRKQHPGKSTTEALHLYERAVVWLRLLLALVKAGMDIDQIDRVLEFFAKDYGDEFYVPPWDGLAQKIKENRGQTAEMHEKWRARANLREQLFREIRNSHPVGTWTRLEVLQKLRTTLPMGNHYRVVSIKRLQNSLSAKDFP